MINSNNIYQAKYDFSGSSEQNDGWWYCVCIKGGWLRTFTWSILTTELIKVWRIGFLIIVLRFAILTWNCDLSIVKLLDWFSSWVSPSLDFWAVIWIFLLWNSLDVTVVSLVYTYLTRGIEDSVWEWHKSSWDRSRWCHLSTHLVLHHTVWSAQKGMSTS